ncbi:hypothetical protein HH214_11890 [Mucilaginibacter robiniae]|uniref:Uncharacterized protein n=1 Tax=Mucilaginibacter robiniae TaxID=2728022 RepID=A0A7L5E850_9SPHI|nr:hypothetical protein [Mucilaginibacter robiniae]QJD96526.1 hypothetical protein HH214_11890 [Mucilaginibacter robiniae]
MKRIVIKNGDIPLNYYTLLSFLEDYKINFFTLNFAQLLLSEEIYKGYSDSTYDRVVKFYRAGHAEIQKLHDTAYIDPNSLRTVELQKDIIQDNFNKLTRFGAVDIESTLASLNFQNFHFIRTKFINSIYEILEKYILKYEQQFEKSISRRTHLRNRLQMKDWYIMLYILRNTASHADGLETPFIKYSFLKSLPKNTFVWKEISVTVGMLSHQIRYNNDELLELYNELHQFIKCNFDLFTKSNRGEILTKLLT